MDILARSRCFWGLSLIGGYYWIAVLDFACLPRGTDADVLNVRTISTAATNAHDPPFGSLPDIREYNTIPIYVYLSLEGAWD